MLGGGAGVYWESDGFSLSTSYVSADANDGNPNTGGLMTDGAGTSATTQIAYAPENWGIAGAFTYASGAEDGGSLYIGNANTQAAGLSASGNTYSYGVSAWWMPDESGWIPSISTGWGLSSIPKSNIVGIESATTQSWYVGLEWSDVFMMGNSFGMAVGMPTFVTSMDSNGNLSDHVPGAGYAWEFFYKFTGGIKSCG